MNFNKEKSIWSNNQFLLLWGGNSIASLTFYMFTFSLPIIIFEYTNSSFSMALLRALEVLPNILFGILIGVLVDRLNKKNIIIFSVVIQIICLLVIFYSLNVLDNLLVVYVMSFILFIAGYLFGNAFHTVLPSIVKREQLVSANSSITFINTLITIIGPSLAGFTILFISTKNILLISVLGLIVLLICTFYLNIPIKSVKKDNRESLFSEILQGWNALKENKELWNMTIIILFSNISNGLTGAVLIFYALNNLNSSEHHIALIMSSTGVGALVASLVAKKIRNKFDIGKIIITLLAISFFGQFTIFLAFDWYILSVGLIIISFSLVLFNIYYLTLRQERTPIELLGRVAGTSSMIMKFSVPISYLLSGIAAEFVSPRYVFLVSTIIILCLFFYSLKKNLLKLT